MSSDQSGAARVRSPAPSTHLTSQQPVYVDSEQLLRVQVGAGLGVSLRYVRQFTEKTAGRVVAKAGLAGLELELGATRRVSEFSTAGLGVAVGTQVTLCISMGAVP